MTDAPSIYQKCRTDVAGMLGYDLDALTAEQSTRLDIGTALRVLLDNQSGRLLRGESLDARELLMASDALAKILPPLREPPPAINAPDPRQIMLESYMAMRKRGELFDGCSTFEGRGRRIAELEARVAELEAAGAPAPGEPSAPLPDNVVALPNATAGKQNSARRASPQPPKPEPPPAAASAPVFGDLVTVVNSSPDEPWREFIAPDGSISPTPVGGSKWWGPV